MTTAPAAFEVRDQGEPIATVWLTTSGVEVDAGGVRNDAVRALLLRATRKTQTVGWHPPGTNIDGTQEVPADPAVEYDTVRWMLDDISAYEVIEVDSSAPSSRGEQQLGGDSVDTGNRR